MLLPAATLTFILSFSLISAEPSVVPKQIPDSEPCPQGCSCIITPSNIGFMDVECPSEEVAKSWRESPPMDASVEDLVEIVDMKNTATEVEVPKTLENNTMQGDEPRTVTAYEDGHEMLELLKFDEVKVETDDDVEDVEEQEEDPPEALVDIPLSFPDDKAPVKLSVKSEKEMSNPPEDVLQFDNDVMQGDQPDVTEDEEDVEEDTNADDEGDVEETKIRDEPIHFDEKEESITTSIPEDQSEESDEDDSNKEVESPASEDNNEEAAEEEEEEEEDSSEVEDNKPTDVPLVFPEETVSENPLPRPSPSSNKPASADESAILLRPDPPLVEDNNEEEADYDEDGDAVVGTSTMLSIISRMNEIREQQQQVISPDDTGDVILSGDVMDGAMSGKMISDEGVTKTMQPQQSYASWVVLGLILTTFVSVLGYAVIRGRMDKNSEGVVKERSVAVAPTPLPQISEPKVNRKPDSDGTEMTELSRSLLHTTDEDNVLEFIDEDGEDDEDKLEQVVVADVNKASPEIEQHATQRMEKPPRKMIFVPPPVVNNVCSPDHNTPTMVKARIADLTPQVVRIVSSNDNPIFE